MAVEGCSDEEKGDVGSSANFQIARICDSMCGKRTDEDYPVWFFLMFLLFLRLNLLPCLLDFRLEKNIHLQKPVFIDYIRKVKIFMLRPFLCNSYISFL